MRCPATERGAHNHNTRYTTNKSNDDEIRRERPPREIQQALAQALAQASALALAQETQALAHGGHPEAQETQALAQALAQAWAQALVQALEWVQHSPKQALALALE